MVVYEGTKVQTSENDFVGCLVSSLEGRAIIGDGSELKGGRTRSIEGKKED